MSKNSKKKGRISPNQMALQLEVFAIETPGGTLAAAGDCEIDAGLRKMIATTLDNAYKNRLTRERVADMMSEQLGRQITKVQLDQWAAPSQTDKRMPADALLAMIETCNDFSAIEWVAHRNGRRVLTEDEALCAEFGAMALVAQQARAQQKRIEGQMDEALVSNILQRVKQVNRSQS